jgi:hypothetical protein
MDLNGPILNNLRTDRIHHLHLSGPTTADSDKETHRMINWLPSQKLPHLMGLILSDMVLTNANCSLLQGRCLDWLSLKDCEDASDSFQNLITVKKLSIAISKRPSTKIHVPQGVEELCVSFFKEYGADSTNDTPKLSIYADKCSNLMSM